MTYWLTPRDHDHNHHASVARIFHILFQMFRMMISRTVCHSTICFTKVCFKMSDCGFECPHPGPGDILTDTCLWPRAAAAGLAGDYAGKWGAINFPSRDQTDGYQWSGDSGSQQGVCVHWHACRMWHFRRICNLSDLFSHGLHVLSF